MNIVILKGNLTRSPEIKEISKDLSVTKFGLAVNKRVKNKDGEYESEAEFIELECWNKRGEAIANNFDKGSPILIRGEFKTDRWETDNEKKSRSYVVVNDFDFCDRKDN